MKKKVKLIAVVWVGVWMLTGLAYGDILSEGLTYTYDIGDAFLDSSGEDTVPPSKLTDGITFGYWSEAGSSAGRIVWKFDTAGTTSIAIDLGELSYIDEVRLHHLNGSYYGVVSPHTVSIETSSDNLLWQEVSDWTNPVQTSQTARIDPNYNIDNYLWVSTGQLSDVQGRYVRITMGLTTRNEINKWIAGDEFQVLGTVVPEPASLVLLGLGSTLLFRKRK